jgi:hypothetical protein
MDLYYLSIIVATLVGFCALAWMLLAPIWRFLDREQEVSKKWTKEALARRRRQQQRSGDEADNAPDDGETERPPRPAPSGDGAPRSDDRGPQTADRSPASR